MAVDDPNSDRGRRSKVKPRAHNRQLVENATHESTSRAPEVQTISIKERSKSRESAKLPSKGTASDVEGSGRDMHGIIDAHADYSGPIAAAELAKMKRELDSWKKARIYSLTIISMSLTSSIVGSRKQENYQETKQGNFESNCRISNTNVVQVIEELKQHDNTLRQVKNLPRKCFLMFT